MTTKTNNHNQEDQQPMTTKTNKPMFDEDDEEYLYSLVVAIGDRYYHNGIVAGLEKVQVQLFEEAGRLYAKGQDAEAARVRTMARGMTGQIADEIKRGNEDSFGIKSDEAWRRIAMVEEERNKAKESLRQRGREAAERLLVGTNEDEETRRMDYDRE